MKTKSQTKPAPVAHTPTPWRLCEAGPIEHRNGPWIHRIISSQLGIYMLAEGDTREEVLANAAFIVRACNSHDGLVAALKSCMDRIEDEYPKAEADEYLALARAAIKKATTPQEAGA